MDNKTCGHFIKECTITYAMHTDAFCDGKDMCCMYYTGHRNKKDRKAELDRWHKIVKDNEWKYK